MDLNEIPTLIFFLRCEWSAMIRQSSTIVKTQTWENFTFTGWRELGIFFQRFAFFRERGGFCRLKFLPQLRGGYFVLFFSNTPTNTMNLKFPHNVYKRCCVLCWHLNIFFPKNGVTFITISVNVCFHFEALYCGHAFASVCVWRSFIFAGVRFAMQQCCSFAQCLRFILCFKDIVKWFNSCFKTLYESVIMF